jgi:hypothetical protein
MVFVFNGLKLINFTLLKLIAKYFDFLLLNKKNSHHYGMSF